MGTIVKQKVLSENLKQKINLSNADLTIKLFISICLPIIFDSFKMITNKLN